MEESFRATDQERKARDDVARAVELAGLPSTRAVGVDQVACGVVKSRATGNVEM